MDTQNNERLFLESRTDYPDSIQRYFSHTESYSPPQTYVADGPGGKTQKWYESAGRLPIGTVVYWQSSDLSAPAAVTYTLRDYPKA